MKKFAKFVFAACAAAAIVFTACATKSGGSADDKAIADGVKAWNKKEPEAARNFWAEIQDAKTKAKYENYLDLYNAGHAALEKTDSDKSESKLLADCNTALDKFKALDSALELPPDDCDKGASVTAARISPLLAAGSVTTAKNLHDSAVKVYGDSDELKAAQKEIDVVSAILDKKASCATEANKARAIDSFDEKMVAMDKALAAYTSAEKALNTQASNAGVAANKGVKTNLSALKQDKQHLEVERETAVREKAYEFKDKIGEEFARSPEKGQKGEMTIDEILAHYNSVKANIDKIYDEFSAFATKYPEDVDKEILNDINSQKRDLEQKIAQIKAEIARREEIASRGKTVMPLMIGLFNADPRSTKGNEKSRPAKFSASNQKKEEYWWGMVDIPRGKMNDLVITLKDNRPVRVFNENTRSGSLIEKNNLQDLVNRGSKVGNSWPVLNAGKQLTSNKYFFEIGEGKSKEYSGEVVVYSSFITRSR